MNTPRNLQELADSLAVLAQEAEQRSRHEHSIQRPVNASYEAGYCNALRDTRATVLALIEDINRRIANNNRILNDDAWGQGRYDGRCEAYEDVRGDEPNDSGGG